MLVVPYIQSKWKSSYLFKKVQFFEREDGLAVGALSGILWECWEILRGLSGAWVGMQGVRCRQQNRVF